MGVTAFPGWGWLFLVGKKYHRKAGGFLQIIIFTKMDYFMLPTLEPYTWISANLETTWQELSGK